MKLRGIEFGNVLCASGVQGFFGEGYWFHKPWHLIGMDLNQATFVSKTATAFVRKGNMPLDKCYQPKQFFPKCVAVKFQRGLMLNSVGLSNPGLWPLLAKGQWQKRTEPFLISIMAVADSPEKRLQEIETMVEMISQEKENFSAPFGLQINFSCPNTGHNTGQLVAESEKALQIASTLNVPLMPKYSIASAPVQAVLALNYSPYCDAICVSNTIPFGWLPINWEVMWGSKVSPLAHLGGGGLSGYALLPFVCEWIMRLRKLGFTKPINGGGGILCAHGVDHYHQAGASSAFIGSVAALRPWRVSSIIKRANSLEWRR